jgi:hypothetical protein
MEDTGGEGLTDKFCFKHHAMLVPTITATDCILAATRALTSAIKGTQESPPTKLQAIENLRLLLLGETPLQPVPVDPPPPTLPQPPISPIVDKEPVHIWDPIAICTSSHSPAGTTGPPITQHPALITNDNDDTAVPTQHNARPAHTRAQHRPQQQVHLINAIITEALMPVVDSKSATLFPPHGYVAATRALLEIT